MYKNFYDDSFNYNAYIKIASKLEKEKLENLDKVISFSKKSKDKIKSIKKNIFLVAAVETWCPFARTYVATVKKINEINSNINISFLTFGKACYCGFREKLSIEEDDFVTPTVMILDEEFNLISTFIAYPEKYKNIDNFNKKDYLSGNYSDDIVEELFKFL